jgi:hypothetical protein
MWGEKTQKGFQKIKQVDQTSKEMNRHAGYIYYDISE